MKVKAMKEQEECRGSWKEGVSRLFHMICHQVQGRYVQKVTPSQVSEEPRRVSLRLRGSEHSGSLLTYIVVQCWCICC